MATDLKKFAQVLQLDPTGENGKAVLYAPIVGIQIGGADRRAGKLLELMLGAGLIDETTTIGDASEMLGALGWWLMFWQSAVERDSKDGATLDVAQLRAQVLDLQKDRDDWKERYRSVLAPISEFVHARQLGGGGENVDELLLKHAETLEKTVVRMASALLCVKDYALNPKSPRVNAGNMTHEERLYGACSQAEAALEEAQANFASAWFVREMLK